MKYFDKIAEVKLTWADVLLTEGKVDSYGENAKIVGDSEHGDVRVKLGDIN